MELQQVVAASPQSVPPVTELLKEAAELSTEEIESRIWKRLQHGEADWDRKITKREQEPLFILFKATKDNMKSEQERKEAAELLYQLGLLGSPPRPLDGICLGLPEYIEFRLGFARLQERGDGGQMSRQMIEQDSREVATTGMVSDGVEGTVSARTITSCELLRGYLNLEDQATACRSGEGDQGFGQRLEVGGPLMESLTEEFKSAVGHPDSFVGPEVFRAAARALDDMTSWHPENYVIDLRSCLHDDDPASDGLWAIGADDGPYPRDLEL
jgi:hypothetical protein